jgi:D-inositol-3-phosphate glycosyltransferase
VGGPSGSGLERPDSLVRLADELGLSDLVRFVPPVAQAGLVDWYAASSLVCVPSYNESFGLVAVEAQASGTPVVAAGVGGLTTAVDDEVSGLLVRDHDPATWAAAFERVLLEPGLRERLAEGAVTQARRFGWDRTAADMIAVYEKAQEKMRADVTGVAL